jgi:hypothetical protein
MPAASSSVPRRALASLVAAATLFALAACVEAPDPRDGPSPSVTPSETATAEPDPTATSAPQPLDVACEDLVDADTIYAFDPNYALIGAFDPEPGSPAADDVAVGGVACQWVRESGSGTIDLSVAAYSEAQLDELKNQAFASSTMVPTYGEEAYFEVEGGVGTAIVFQGRYRLVVSSESFFEPGEPTGIIESALAALPAA